ncbi:MAG: hypothetical protein ACYC1C_03260 [Chloroflexota bacterium]
MTVDPSITRQIIAEEVEGLRSLALSCGWEVTLDSGNLTVTVRMKSTVDDQTYILEAKCDGYRAVPPLFELIHPETGERGTRRCYPAGGTFFLRAPCICVQWNRKAYRQLGGPHGDWQMVNWACARPGTTTLGDMFLVVQREINKRGQYRGRMA